MTPLPFFDISFLTDLEIIAIGSSLLIVAGIISIRAYYQCWSKLDQWMRKKDG